MIYLLIFISLTFIAIGWFVTEKNAQYLLSGYNRMSEKERSNIDQTSYIPYFKRFNILLGLSYLIIGLVLFQINKMAAGIFLIVYPILGYIYFTIASSRFSGGLKTKANKISLFVLVGTLLFILGMVTYGLKENKVIYHAQEIVITGDYGQILSADQIESITLINELPKINVKTNGFAIGDVRKGYFKTKNGEIVKLILNSEQVPYILFTQTDGKKIYYSAKQQSNEDIFHEIEDTLPNTFR